MRLSLALIASFSSTWTCSDGFAVPMGNARLLTQPLQSVSGDTNSDGNDAILFGATVPGMPEKPPKAPPVDEDNPMGGQLFRKMMEKAKQGPSRPQPSQSLAQPAPQYSPPPVYGAQQPTPYPSPQVALVDPIQIYNQQLQVWQAQMTAYAQLTASNPSVAAQMQPPPMPQFNPNPVVPQTLNQAPLQAPVSDQTPKVAPKDADPSQLNPSDFLPKSANNRDAYEISNPADVYFAQLKRDSTVRSLARRAGDLETANTPFADVGVQALKGYLSPELIEKRRQQLAQNGGEFETSRDEMILPYDNSEMEVDKSYTGVSYRKKLDERMKKTSSSSKSAALEVPTKQQDLAVEKQPTQPVKNVISSTSSSTSFSTMKEQEKYVPPLPKQSDPLKAPTSVSNEVSKDFQKSTFEQAQDFALKIKEDRELVPMSAPSTEDSEETRKEIRKLMGLLLKHRGGSGFGHGRLKETEARMLVESTAKIMDMLNFESGTPPSKASSMDKTIAKAEVAISDGNASTSHSSASDSALSGAIACAEAALALFKASDPVQQKDLLPSVRDALISATATIRRIVDDTESTRITGEPIVSVYANTMAFPETYRITKPEPEEEPATTETEEQTMSFPETYKVAVSEESSLKPRGKNAQILQNAYESLKSIAGDEKYGMRDIRPGEVSSIKDILMDLRDVLMDELDNGIES